MSENKRKYTKKNSTYWSNLSKKDKDVISLSDYDYEPALVGYEELDEKKKRAIASSSQPYSPASTMSRYNRAGVAKDPKLFKNLKDLELPYNVSNRREQESIDIYEAITLCQKAYAHIAIFRNTIDVMTEFSNSEIHLKGGNKASREFIKKWLKRINIHDIGEQFFRENYRSGNCFIYKFMGKFDDEYSEDLSKIYKKNLKNAEIPLRYTILNPADIVMHNASFLGKSLYKKVLSGYELDKIRKMQTVEDKAVFQALPSEVKKVIKEGGYSRDGITIDLELDRLYTIFYKKQDYEPFAIPFGFPVLRHIDQKLELEKIDRAISRTVQQAVLLVTMGEQDKEGNARINTKAMAKIQALLENESVGRTIVTDYTTEMKFVIPDIGNILDPKKYQIVNEDIKEGLQNIFFAGGEKFSNQQAKVGLFLERLKEGRKQFIDSFLQEEIKLVCREMGFKSYPIAEFQETDLQDKVQFHRIWTRLLELGVLTPEQTFKAMKTGVLPDQEELNEAQMGYVEDRKKGYYNPIVGGMPFISPPQGDGEKPLKNDIPKGPNPNAFNNGRPSGASIKGMKMAYSKINRLITLAINKVKKKYNLTTLNSKQEDAVFKLITEVISTSAPNDWNKSIENGLEDTNSIYVKTNENVKTSVANISSYFNIDKFSAALYYYSSISWDEL